MDLSTPSPDVFAAALRRYTKRDLALALGIDARTVLRWGDGDSIDKRSKMSMLWLLSKSARGHHKAHDFTFIDLFAGIGGMRMGFESAGGKCVFTSEWDTACKRTYGINFGEADAIYGDITELTRRGEYDLIPTHDVLLAGFPCQPFSIAGVSKKKSLGRAHGFACEAQGTLFFDLAKIIDEKRPLAFVLENVKNLKSHDGGNTFAVIRKILEGDLKYTFHEQVIDAQGFVPQHRERLFIVGFRKEVGFSWDAFHRPPLKGLTLGSILHPENGSEQAEEPFTCGKKASVAPKYTLTPRLWAYLKAYKEKHQAQGNGFGFGVFGRDGIARTLSARYYKDGSEILIQQRNRNPRRLTPRECARLMGFDSPDRPFAIEVSDTSAYKQFGNAVCVPVVKEVARIVKPFVVGLREAEAAGTYQEGLFDGSRLAA